MRAHKARMIRLYCPSLAKTVPLVAEEEQRLDLGSIARSFGLDPWSLRLNGHFISRGMDLISSSVTWRSLFSFFSSKGLSTGTDDSDALIIDGKLLKVGTKRRHDPQESSASLKVVCNKDGGTRRRQAEEDMAVSERKKLKEGNVLSQTFEFSGHGYGGPEVLKRKHSLEDLNLLKRLKIDNSSSDSGKEKQGLSNSSRLPILPFSCRYIGERLKRRREDEAIAPSPSKRIR